MVDLHNKDSVWNDLNALGFFCSYRFLLFLVCLCSLQDYSNSTTSIFLFLMPTTRIPLMMISTNEDFLDLDVHNKDSLIVDLHNKDSLMNDLVTLDSLVPLQLFLLLVVFDCSLGDVFRDRHPPGPCACPCGWPGDGVDGWLV